MEDSAIVQLYWDREERAIAASDEKYGGFLRQVAWGVLRDREDSDEAVNDAYLAAWWSMPPHRPDLLRAFLAKLTRRTSIDKLRRRRAEKRGGGEYALALDELAECLSGGGDPQGAVELTELAGVMDRWLREQSEPTRRLFLRRYFYADSLKEAAAFCGMGEGAAKSALHRARLRLGQRLRQEGYL